MMNVWLLLRKLAKEERGLALVLISLAMTALVGIGALVTDIGLVALNKNRLVNAADAAALAGVQELPQNPAAAQAVALNYAELNGVPAKDVEVKLIKNLSTSQNVGVEVKVARNVEYILAKALGFTSIDLKARAVAHVLPSTSAKGAAPLFIKDQDLVFGQEYVLRSKDKDFGPGNFGALDFGSGAKTFEETLANGFEGEIKVNYQIDTLTGVKKQKTIEGIQSRINKCNHGCTFNSFQADCSRVLLVPVVQYDSLNGTKPVKVVGFAALFVDSVGEDGSGSKDPIRITGRFVKTLAQGEGSLNQKDYGLRTAKLVE